MRRNVLFYNIYYIRYVTFTYYAKFKHLRQYNSHIVFKAKMLYFVFVFSTGVMQRNNFLCFILARLY